MQQISPRIACLQRWIDSSKRIVFYSGYEVAHECGYPSLEELDQRCRLELELPLQEVLTLRYLRSNPADFYQIYRHYMLRLDLQPNIAHKRLAELERSRRMMAIITPNTDDLHRRAGSRRVFEMRNSIRNNMCIDCRMSYDVYWMATHPEAYPRCVVCGGLVRPMVALYDEPPAYSRTVNTCDQAGQADLLIIAGASLTDPIVNRLIQLYHGPRLVLIRRNATHQEWQRADLTIRKPLTKVFENLYVPQQRVRRRGGLWL